MYEPGSPSSALPTITLSGSLAFATSSTGAGGEAGTAAAPNVGRLDLAQQLLGRQARERVAKSAEVAARQEHRLVEHALTGRLVRGPGGPRRHAIGHARTCVDHVTVANRRGRVAEAEAHRGAERDLAVVGALSRCQPEPLPHRLHVGTEVRRPARRAGADRHVAAPARLGEVVVEGGDPVHDRLGEAGQRRCLATVLVGDLAPPVHRLLERRERGGALLALSRAK